MVIGGAMTCEAYGMTVPDPAGTGVREAVSAALSGDISGEIAWIKTHGTGTRLNDAAEQHGLVAVFGDRLAAIPLTSLKPTVGHCLGASGGVEAVAGVLALEAGMIPPTLGTTDVDPALMPCRVPLVPTPISGKRALLLSESFGGRCVALALERPPGDGISQLGH
jgi:3-oxoacyl-[acyl-carrier-protein] synthase II